MITTIATIATNETAVASSIGQVKAPAASEASLRSSFRELNDAPVVEVDVLEQLKTNLAQLEDLHARLRFMMTEITYLLKK